MILCRECNFANGSAFPEGECWICGGGALREDGMLREAAALLKAAGAGSFSISTIIPKDWLAREEKAWDVRSAGAESVKNYMNRKAVSALREASGLRYDYDGDVRLVLDFQAGKVSIQRNELFVFGRYRKLAAGLSQSRWKCPKCGGKGCARCEGKGKLYVSVEEKIGEPLKSACAAEDYVMHASGREDVDATNSAGRPFVFEIKSPEKRVIDLAAAAAEIAKSGEVAVLDLRIVPRSFCEVVTESHFDKAYEAEVEFGRTLGEDDLEKIRSLEGKTILQQTPARVAHRRADLVRHRKVKHVEVANIREAGGRWLATLIIRAEAGTYIKELISGDRGRTKPSVAELLGTGAECKRLEVTMIDDGFLDFCMG
ncbi:MAG: tRNA pseudouridine(54/55) synthase Pus10 [Candidatus Micrarchaeota archaeon]